MTANIIDGKELAHTIQTELKSAVSKRLKKGLRAPSLAVIIVGSDPASQIYISKKRKCCKAIGFTSVNYDLDKDIAEIELINLIQTLNQNPDIDGILVQLPLPAHIDMNKVIDTINPAKDVDGFHPHNIGLLAQKRPKLRPCTPRGISIMLKRLIGDITGKHAVIIGSSNIVGRPLAMELIWQNCTVTICHRHTHNLPNITKQADILIAAVGKPKFVQAEWIKAGAIVVDVGINRLPSGKLVGDVDFEAAKEKVSWITPVPGGVGPMTVASLMENTLLAAEMHHDTR